MLYLINDTEINLEGSEAVAVSQGGTSAFLAGFINHLFKKRIHFGLWGNFISNRNDVFLQQIKPRSNLQFLFGLFLSFFKKRLSASDILYFQRPDHLAVSFFCPAKKILHLHGPVRSTIITGRRFIPKTVFLVLETLAVHKADLIIATDSRTAELYNSVYPHIRNKIRVIPAGFDDSFFQPKPELPLPVKKGKSLLFAGRLAHPKRISDMIEAFALASVINNTLLFYIAGDGPLMQQSQALTRKLGVGDRVIFTGLLSKPELKKLILSCDAGILLSHSEGSPISVKEILACGKPVIVSDVGDLKDYILNDITGYIVEAVNHQQVADAILKVTDNAGVMAASCIEIAGKYDDKHINGQILELILSA